MNCGECGSKEMLPFDNETFKIKHLSKEVKVDNLSGWRCTDCGGVVFTFESAHKYAAAGDELIKSSREHIANLLGAERRGTSKATSDWFGAQQSILDHRAMKKKEDG